MLAVDPTREPRGLLRTCMVHTPPLLDVRTFRGTRWFALCLRRCNWVPWKRFPVGSVDLQSANLNDGQAVALQPRLISWTSRRSVDLLHYTFIVSSRCEPEPALSFANRPLRTARWHCDLCMSLTVVKPHFQLRTAWRDSVPEKGPRSMWSQSENKVKGESPELQNLTQDKERSDNFRNSLSNVRSSPSLTQSVYHRLYAT
jgi:hypothetical protein